MIGFKIKDATSLFFDKKKVMAAADKATIRNLSKIGAFIRRTAKGLLRSGKKPSKPGSPPKSHMGLLKRFIFFIYDAPNRSVVIGPASLNKPTLGDGGEPLPEILEYGGTITIIESQSPTTGKWLRPWTGWPPPTWRMRKRQIKIAPRPYMGPAYMANAGKIPGIYADSIKS